MKRAFALLFLVLSATSALAGTSYRFDSTTTGPANSQITGTVRAEGTSMRMDITKGDGVMFADGAVIVTRDGGRTLTVADPSKKTYYELRADDLAGGALKSISAMANMTVENETAKVRDGGDGGTIAGFPTRRSITDSSFDLLLDAMGQKMRMKVAMTVESWTTDRIGADLTNLFQMRNIKTGIDAIDKIVATQSASLRGFPLKQVATVRFNDIVSTTTTQVSDVKQGTFAAAQFALPAGYRKVANPIERLTRQ